MAADLAAKSIQQTTPEEMKGLEGIRAGGVEMTTVTEMMSMAAPPQSMMPLLVSLKAVDPALYPFYGEISLAPAMGLKTALGPGSVAVGDDLLLRLGLHVGDNVRVGGKLFRIAATVVDEPDRLSGNFEAGPRVLISREALDATGLLAPGNHATERVLFKLPPPGDGRPVSDAAVAALKTKIAALLPEAQVTDYRETNPSLTEGLDRRDQPAVADEPGGIGAGRGGRGDGDARAPATAAGHDRDHEVAGGAERADHEDLPAADAAAGAGGGIAGRAAGGCGAACVSAGAGQADQCSDGVAPAVEGDLYRAGRGPADDAAVYAAAAAGHSRGEAEPDPAEGGGGQRRSVYRGGVEEDHQKCGADCGDGGDPGGNCGDCHDVVGFGGGGTGFSLGLVIVLLVLLAASAAVLWGLKFFLNRTRLHLPSALRHGLANLYRPGNPSAALLAALGMGVMQIMTVYLVQRAVVNELHITSAPNLPNVFLVDIANSEIDGIQRVLKAQPGVTTQPELVPMVGARVEAMDGVTAAEARAKADEERAQEQAQGTPRNARRRRMPRSVNLTWSEAVPVGTKVVAGEWWKAGERGPELAISQQEAQWLGVKLGSTITFAVEDQQIAATVVALTKDDGQHLFGRAQFTLPKAALDGLPVVWSGGVHVTPERVGELQRALYAAYPTVTVINVAQAMETVRAVVIQITYVIQFLAAFSIFAGVVILASSIAGTKYRRIREVVVLKTLGATRGRIATIFSIEFAVLGLVAGVVGIGFANLITRTLLHQMNVAYKAQLLLNFSALAGVAALTVATGWMASHRILEQKPLEVLREE